jgi:hypothetical protein
LEIVASHLNNPRKLSVAADGALYVAEAGTGGREKCFGRDPGAVCVGRTGSVARIADGVWLRPVTGLVSWANRAHQRALGPAQALVRDGTTYVLLDDDTVQPDGTNALGPAGMSAGDLIGITPGRKTKVIADFAAFEAKHNPDRGEGPGRRLGNPPIDSDPYAFTPFRGGFAVVDAGANDLLWVSPKGAISVLAVFPTQSVELTRETARRIGAPASLRSIQVQAVPSCVVVGPDGALYVGELTARPFARGIARVWRVVPGKTPTVYASGFTNISDIAFAGPNLLVLEIAHEGLYESDTTGALIRITPDRRSTVIAREGLLTPTGLAVSGGFAYISNHGTFPGVGPEPNGQVVRLAVS